MKGVEISSEAVAQLEELRRQGLSFGEISRKTGVSLSTVARRLKGIPAGGENVVFSEEMSAEEKDALVDEINSSIAEVNEEPQAEQDKPYTVPVPEPINACIAPEQAEPDKPEQDEPLDVVEVAQIGVAPAKNLRGALSDCPNGARVEFGIEDGLCTLEVCDKINSDNSITLNWRCD